MQDKKTISGFSKLSKHDKIEWIAGTFFENSENVVQELGSFSHQDEQLQRVLDGFSENTISNFYLPYGVAPNFVINGKPYVVPMVIEESSVVAAASSAAKFWMNRGGFKAEVISTIKVGQVHFLWAGIKEKLQAAFEDLKIVLLKNAADITANMEKRGGGILDIALLDLTASEKDYFQLKVNFETCESMGANFINSVLENFGRTLEIFCATRADFEGSEKNVDVIMAILSNYTPECLVRASVECPIENLKGVSKMMDEETFAKKFYMAIRIAHIDPHRATTHNKGIFNGIDAVVLATGNDFRAIEAGGHTYAAKDGQYRSLSHCTINDGVFKFWIDVPMALGTVGGLTNLHPMARRSLELLGNPTAEELMMVVATTGLAQNFGAIRSLTTTGIQHGHMKMHLVNILNHLGATEQEMAAAVVYFADKMVSFAAVREFLETSRS